MFFMERRMQSSVLCPVILNGCLMLRCLQAKCGDKVSKRMSFVERRMKTCAVCTVMLLSMAMAHREAHWLRKLEKDEEETAQRQHQQKGRTRG